MNQAQEHYATGYSDFLEIKGISLAAERGPVLQDINFTQQEFQRVAIAGETGSGKSTLLKVIAGLAQPTAGQVFFEGDEVEGPAEKLVPGHPGIAYLSQHFELPKSLRVEQVLKYTNTLPQEDAETLYDVCRITHLLKRRTDQLSGGEKQRVAVARLLSSSPRLLLLDEPFSNLDMVHKSTLKAVIQDIGERLQITCAMVSHDPLDSLSWADQILVMKAGQVLQQGAPEQVYRQPGNEYIAGLFGKYTLLSPALAKAFAVQPSEGMQGKKALVRPESFKLATGNSSVEGKVKQVAFFGSYYEAEVILAAGTVTVRTADSSVSSGDAVAISLPPGAVWFVEA
ncbi:ABC transporter ATP-binding protein [Pontibacter akesuensis]|nr:ABC transporter ATP-binding protein [Pontibacter akesuensis]GHA74049.1 ABC transporter ATP-binding protein [Pontibacter akesuensis]